jgi:hypothetical protein
MVRTKPKHDCAICLYSSPAPKKVCTTPQCSIHVHQACLAQWHQTSGRPFHCVCGQRIARDRTPRDGMVLPIIITLLFSFFYMGWLLSVSRTVESHARSPVPAPTVIGGADFNYSPALSQSVTAERNLFVVYDSIGCETSTPFAFGFL